MKTILKVENLTKSFENTKVLNNINFEVEEGEFIAIMGQSGSGKSTLLYSISGMDRPTSGDVLLLGKEISKKALSKEKRLYDWLEKQGF